VPPSVAEFRETFRREHIPSWYLGWLHFATTSIGSLAVIGWALSRVHHPRLLELATVPLTFLFANFVEYRGHKGPMHHPMKPVGMVFERHTLQHHHFFTADSMTRDSARDFKIMLFPILLIGFFIGLHAVPIFLVLWFFVSANAAALFLATAIGYFLTYEWLHFAYHLPPDSLAGRLPFMARLRQHHTRHHDLALMSRGNFNITFPICDWIFGTTLKP
jgi:hypothetical protein